MNIQSLLQNCRRELLTNAIYCFFNVVILSSFGVVGILVVLPLVYLPLLAMIYTDIYEDYMCLISGARPLKTKKEREYLEPLLDEICASFENPELKLYIINDFSINAFAMGAKSIAITKGAINGLTKEQLTGLMAHEAGHISCGHPLGSMLGTFGNGLFSLIALVFKMFGWLLKNIPNYADEEVTYEAGFIVRALTNMFNFFVLLMNSITALLNSARSREHERQADHYAAYIGYGIELLSALYALDGIVPEGYIDMKQHLTRTHPYLYDRIAILEHLQDSQ